MRRASYLAQQKAIWRQLSHAGSVWVEEPFYFKDDAELRQALHWPRDLLKPVEVETFDGEFYVDPDGYLVDTDFSYVLDESRQLVN